MSAPSIVAFRVVSPIPKPGYAGTLAVLTIEHGPWIIAGVRLCIEAGGRLFFRPPKMKAFEDRIVLRGSPERDALLVQARGMMVGFLGPLMAATPLAPAPGMEHSPP